jgi:hypothetical protein
MSRIVLMVVVTGFASAATSAAWADGRTAGGVVAQTSSQAMAFRNDQKWDAGDNTGNSSIDSVLDMIAGKVIASPPAISALESVAFDVKMAPQDFVMPNGAMRADALRARLKQRFATVGGYDIDVLWPNVRRGSR